MKGKGDQVPREFDSIASDLGICFELYSSAQHFQKLSIHFNKRETHLSLTF